MKLEQNELQELGNPLRSLKKTFDDAIIPYRKDLWRYCYHLTGSPWDAEELVQETLLKAFSSLPQLWQPIYPKSYLFKIASNTWLDICRKKRLKMDPAIDVQDLVSVENDDLFEMEEAMELLVIHLPPRQRVVLLLIEAFQLKAKEVASLIDSSEGSVKAMLHRARKKLTKLKLERQVNKQLDKTVIIPIEVKSVIDQYIAAFNRRDPDEVASLLVGNASNDIVHISKEYGKDIIRKNSLEEWSKDPVDMKAELYYLWGKPTLVQFGIDASIRKVYGLNTFEMEHGQITQIKDYYFCPELLEAVAKELSLEAFQRRYVY